MLIVVEGRKPLCPLFMINLSQLNADRLKNDFHESQLKKFDPHLYLRFDDLRNRWMVFEYYPENVYIKPLFWLEDSKGEPKEFGQWVINKLNVQHLNWKHKEEVGSNKWCDELFAEADKQKKELEEKIAQENLYQYKHDKLQWRKGAAELLNRPNDVFAGYQYQPKPKEENVKLTTSTEQSAL